LKRRFNEHLSLLQRGKHDNIHLQRAFNKYGSEAFVMFMMQPCAAPDLDRIEQEWVDLFWDGCKTCYNIKAEASKPPNRKGAKLTPEQLRMWSEVKKGKKFTEDHKRKIGETRKGKERTPFTDEWKLNISKAQAKTFDVKLLSPTGEVFGPITNLNAFSKTHGLLPQGLGALIRGKISQTKGWRLLP
jgi:group I intron endonuclease